MLPASLSLQARKRDTQATLRHRSTPSLLQHSCTGLPLRVPTNHGRTCVTFSDERALTSRLCRRAVLGGLALIPAIWQQSAQRSQAYDLEMAKAQ